MTKVLQIINAMYPFTGGMTQVTEDIMRALSESGNFEQKIICFNEDAESDGVVTHRNQTVHDHINGIEIIRCGSIAKVASQLISLTFKRELKNVVNSFKPDIIILHYPNPFAAHMLLPLLKKFSNIKFILFWHLDIIRQKILGKFFYWQNIKLLERADKIIATSQNYINGSLFLKRYEKKCVIIPCCVQDKRIIITPEIQEKADSIRKKYNNKFISISVGRLVKYKGFDYLIKSCEFLDDDFRIFIAGAGSEYKELKQLSSNNNNNIIFLGKISNKDLNAYYLASDVISFPSITKNEAFGIALAEGMYFGKPAITFTIPGSGVNYVNIDGLTGIECPNRDSKAFAHALITLKNDIELRKTFGHNARERVINNFMYETFRDKIINTINF